MLETAPILKLTITTLRKKIAMQIRLHRNVAKNSSVLGWISAQDIGWRNGTGIATLHEQDGDYFWMTARRHHDGNVIATTGQVIERQIFIT